MRNLIALWKIGVKVILAGENAPLGDVALQGKSDEQGERDSLFINNRKSAGHTGANFTNGSIRLSER